MINLFLDDFRIPQQAYNHTYDTSYLKLDWVLVKNYDEFVKFVEVYVNENGFLPQLISFDHDLGWSHYDYTQKQWADHYNNISVLSLVDKTGYDCCKWLVELCMDRKIPLCEFKSHSQNSVGKENISMYLNNYKKHQHNFVK